jgi:hypothetical protein
VDEIYVVVLLIFGVPIIAVVLWYLWLRQRSHSWPEMPGRIEQVRVKTLDVRERLVDRHRPFAAIIEFSYSVNGEYYGGILQKRFILESQAERCAARYEIGQPVVVRYKPKSPEISVMIE